MNKLSILKSATGMIASAGAGAVVGNAIKASTPVDIKTSGKVLVMVGGVVLSSMVGDMASKYTANSIDDMAESLKPESETTTEDHN